MTTTAKPQPSIIDPEEAVRRVAKARQVILDEVHKVVVGQDEMIELMLTAMFAQGHLLATGTPGLAKSLTVSALAKALHLKHSRIQFTPDLLPSDVVGFEFLEQGPDDAPRSLRFSRGPVFAGIVLAEEVDLTPPRTQSVLLQAMQDRQVPVGAHKYDMESPFLVVATENPVGQRGRYPLAESQRDRFMFSVNIGYPTREQEQQIVNATTRFDQAEVRQVLRSRDILWIQQLVRQVPATEHVVDYAVDLARATRPAEPDAPDFVKERVAIGASTRAAQQLILAAKARALVKQRCAACAADVRAMARPVLAHRITLKYDDSGSNVTVDQILDKLLQTVEEPFYGERPAPPALVVVDPGSQSDSTTSSESPSPDSQVDEMLPPPAAPNTPSQDAGEPTPRQPERDKSN